MGKDRHSLPSPSESCMVVGFGVAAIGSFLITLVLGTGYGFGLVLISGIGRKLETMLNDLDVWQFAQIAAWTDDELDWVDSRLGTFRGRARRDDWVGQARTLATDGDRTAGPGAQEAEASQPDRS